MLTRRALLAALPAPLLFSASKGMKAGIGRLPITPEGPIWMSGYGNRNKPSEGVVHDLWAKALAVEDPKGNRTVIVTTDLIGFPGSLAEAIAAEVMKQWQLPRSALVLNSSHTHTGPLLRGNLDSMFTGDEENFRRVREYTERLRADLVTVIGAALGNLRPARLRFGQGVCNVALNRREHTPTGVKLGENPQGPVDHAVPVIEIAGEDGETRALLFGYACHNTTLTGNDYELSGDYAGFAQLEVESARPGVTAMFMALCGGDANPKPRGSLDAARQNGKTLGTEVLRVAGSQLAPVEGEIRSAFRVIQLPFRPYTRETLEPKLADKNAFVQKNARMHLEKLEKRQANRTIGYPVQAVRFGNSLTLVALGGEVVVDYALNIKRKYAGREPVVVAGYSNDVMGYVPTRKILEEGGYEAEMSTVYYGFPTPFTHEVEGLVLDAVDGVLRRVGRRK